MRRLSTVPLALLLAACSADPAPAGDASPGGLDASADAAPADGPPFAMPLYRIGPRSAFGGSFGQAPIAGTIELPRSAGVESFADWTFRGHGLAGGPATSASEPEEVGDRLVSEIVIEIDTASSSPAEDREILTARSPDGLVLTAVLEADGTVAFSPESTARNALSLAAVREDAAPFEEVYYTGLRAGDDPILDAKVFAIATAIGEHLAGGGDGGILPGGAARAGTEVFRRIDAAIGEGPAPVIEPPACAGCLGRAGLPAGAGQAAFRSEGGTSPHVPVTGEAFSFFFYTAPAGGDLHLRQRLPDGTQSPASDPFQIGTDDPELPEAVTLTLEGAGARACGATPGHWVVFLASGTELAVGFAALEASADCVELPARDIPAEVALLTAIQVSPEGRVGPPSETVFP